MMKINDPNDLAIIEAAQQDQPGARGRLLDQWLPEVLRWCCRLGGPRVDPEDAAHDVFIVVLTKLETLERPDRFQAWLFGITRRVLARHRRWAWARRWVGGILIDPVDPDQNPATMVELSDIAKKVQLSLESLPQKQREVLVLCDLEERTAAEVASLLEIPVGTVRSRLRNARVQFAKIAVKNDLAPVKLKLASHE
jgi:RNA polymerase sigma-70 factor, ECF subfamily